MSHDKSEYWNTLPKTMPDDLLLEAIESSYYPAEIPSCHICGGKLSIASIGGGPTIWACTPTEDDVDENGKWVFKPGRSVVDDHYSKSRWQQYRHGDSRVMELVKRFKELKGI